MIFRRLQAALYALLFAASAAVAQVGPLGFGPVLFPTAAPAPAATVTFIGTALVNSTLTTYSFASQAIGTASADRWVVVAISAIRSSGSTPSVSSGSIGGIAFTCPVQVSSVVVFSASAICLAQVPTGTTATISITWDNAMANIGISVYQVNNLVSGTATATVSATNAATLALTLSIQAGGIAIGSVGHANTGGARGFTWANLTEDSDFASAGTNSVSAASNAFATTQTSLAITATRAASANDSGVVAAFR